MTTELGLIPKDWHVVRVSEACTKIQDGTHFSPRIQGDDYFYVTSRSIRFGYLDLSSASRIDARQHRAIYRRCDVSKGDLLLTKDGVNTGNAALNTLDEEFSLLPSVAFLRVDESRHDVKYFLQQVLTERGQREIQDAMAGNAITRLTLGKINRLRFVIPPTKDEEVAIAERMACSHRVPWRGPDRPTHPGDAAEQSVCRAGVVHNRRHCAEHSPEQHERRERA